MAYSLYPIKLQTHDPNKLVVIHRTDEKLVSQLPRIYKNSMYDVEIEVLDNSAQTADFTSTNIPLVREQ